jgi:DNA modification methylase
MGNEVLWPADKVERRSVVDMLPYARNARTHTPAQIDLIAKSILEYGWTMPILVDEDNTLIAGHGRILAAKKLKIATVPAMVARGWSEAQRRAYVIADNAIALNGSDWNTEFLKLELADLQGMEFDLELTGLDGDFLKDLFGADEDEAKEGQTDEDETPAAGDSAISRDGDVWILGDHRLACCDSTDVGAVAILMAGDKADMVFTDPPYNHASGDDLVAKNVRKAYKNLAASEWDKGFVFASVEQSFALHLADDATVYVCTSHHLAGSIWAWMETWASHVSACVWQKKNPMPSLMKRHWTWDNELICYATRGRHTFNSPAEGHALSTWTIGRKQAETDHPTEKPVAVPEHAILHSSKRGAVVLDLFGGSGSTLVACEKHGRRARVAEKDPVFVDVIATRWQNFSGGVATLEETGETFVEVMARRNPNARLTAKAGKGKA